MFLVFTSCNELYGMCFHFTVILIKPLITNVGSTDKVLISPSTGGSVGVAGTPLVPCSGLAEELLRCLETSGGGDPLVSAD